MMQLYPALLLWLSGVILAVGFSSCAASASGPGRPGNPELTRDLGEALFFEPALAINGKRSCASCHRPDKAFTDHRITSRALRFTANLTRNAPTLLNATGQPYYFHDGRAGTLEAAIGQVIISPVEMGSSYALITERLNRSEQYRRWFEQALRAPIGEASINAALVAYLESLRSRNAPYDVARRGEGLLPEPALAGQQLFAGTLGCASCHSGPLFRDGQRHEVRPGEWVKTPTLRNVAVTPPYGADGQAATLAQALNTPFHRRQLAQPLTPQQQDHLVAFLQTLTDTTSYEHRAPASLPDLPSLPDRRVGGLY
ncbi:cytochrome-c peroxidase [Hymenobacter psychrophilus]|uniref:Cytochrome c peroxidase n=1 Tax=Hymenobacter psychrophilus TaxID=651662 RepID=A0A1H3DRV0_9BACT|nr:cytochrome c peroxidase [Hymenobacter psychrophilus]SDX69101.1 cytochrome c peroxidase [Hymenobacter psychrophilus]